MKVVLLTARRINMFAAFCIAASVSPCIDSCLKLPFDVNIVWLDQYWMTWPRKYRLILIFICDHSGLGPDNYSLYYSVMLSCLYNETSLGREYGVVSKLLFYFIRQKVILKLFSWKTGLTPNDLGKLNCWPEPWMKLQFVFLYFYSVTFPV